MPKSRLFLETVSRLVSLNASTTLEYVLEEAAHIEQDSLQRLPCQKDMLLVLDAQDRIIACNSVSAFRLGRHLHDLLGQKLWTLLPPHIAGFRRNIVTLARERNTEFHYLDNLSTRWLDTFVEPLGGGMMLIRASDITDGARFYFSGGHVQLIAASGVAHIID